MSYIAYVDESEPSSGGSYLLSCALVDDASAENARTAMIAAKTAGEKKVHWHGRLPAERPALVDLVAGFGGLHLIVVRDECHDEPSERRRRKCLEHLLWTLDTSYGVRSIVLESRQAKQNAGDMHLLQAMRAAGQVSRRLRIDHVAGPKEALLWIPDVVAGAFNAGRAGESALYAPLAGLVDVQSTP